MEQEAGRPVDRWRRTNDRGRVGRRDGRRHDRLAGDDESGRLGWLSRHRFARGGVDRIALVVVRGAGKRRDVVRAGSDGQRADVAREGEHAREEQGEAERRPTSDAMH